MLDGLHYLSAGAVGFARGLNDTPKIVAMLLASEALAPRSGVLLVAGMMALGGLLSAIRVARTMSLKITAMDASQGFCANLVTSAVVLTASRYGLPVSATHVSVGALFGLGAVTGTARFGVVGPILLAWGTVLPMSAAIAAATYSRIPYWQRSAVSGSTRDARRAGM